MVSTYTKSNKKKKANQSSMSVNTRSWCLVVPRSNPKKRGNQIVLRLGDGAHLHLKTTKQKEIKGELQLHLCRDLAMARTCV